MLFVGQTFKYEVNASNDILFIRTPTTRTTFGNLGSSVIKLIRLHQSHCLDLPTGVIYHWDKT